MARPFDLVPIQISRLGPLPGRARREVLFIHGAWRGSWVWDDLAQRVAKAGFGVNLLELPGHGQPVWDLPWSTSLKDYAMYAARAAGGLPRPVLLGHSMGGWIVQKILEATDLPAVLLAPLPGSGLPLRGLVNFVLDHPREVIKGMIGRPMVFDDSRGAREPVRAVWEMGLGLARAKPHKGKSPRLLIAAGQDRLVPLGAQTRLARRLNAGLIKFPDLPHELWQEDSGGKVAAAVLAFLDRNAGGGA